MIGVLGHPVDRDLGQPLYLIFRQGGDIGEQAYILFRIVIGNTEAAELALFRIIQIPTQNIDDVTDLVAGGGERLAEGFQTFPFIADRECRFIYLPVAGADQLQIGAAIGSDRRDLIAAGYCHGVCSFVAICRRSRRMILPVVVIGMASRNLTTRGYS